MSWVAVAIGGGALLGAAGNIAGGMLASDSGVTQRDVKKDTLTSGTLDQANPIFNALQLNLLGGLGMPIENLVNAASPLTQLQNIAASGTLGFTSLQNQADLIAGLRNIQSVLSGTVDPRLKRAIELPEGFDPSTASSREIAELVLSQIPGSSLSQLQNALVASGFQNLEQLIDAERTFRQQTSAMLPQLQQASANIQQGRTVGTDLMLSALQDFPRAGQSDINRLADVERERAREALLQAANVAGVNPAAGLAEIERDPNPIARALALLDASQQLAMNQFQTGAGAFFGPVELATQGASPLLAAAAGDQSIAAQQAASLFKRGQGDMGPAGTGVANAGTALGSGLQTLFFADMLKQSQSGGAGTTGLPVNMHEWLNILAGA